MSNTGPEDIARPAGRGVGSARAGAGTAVAGQTRVEKQPVPLWRWAVWWCLLAPALVLFYGVFTPVWLGVRIVRLLAHARSR